MGKYNEVCCPSKSSSLIQISLSQVKNVYIKGKRQFLSDFDVPIDQVFFKKNCFNLTMSGSAACSSAKVGVKGSIDAAITSAFYFVLLAS